MYISLYDRHVLFFCKNEPFVYVSKISLLASFPVKGIGLQEKDTWLK